MAARRDPPQGRHHAGVEGTGAITWMRTNCIGASTPGTHWEHTGRPAPGAQSLGNPAATRFWPLTGLWQPCNPCRHSCPQPVPNSKASCCAIPAALLTKFRGSPSTSAPPRRIQRNQQTRYFDCAHNQNTWFGGFEVKRRRSVRAKLLKRVRIRAAKRTCWKSWPSWAQKNGG